MDTSAKRSGLPQALVLAVGSVAIASADLEGAVRRVVADLCNADPVNGTWLVFEGQSMDWLIQNGKVLVSDEFDSARRHGHGDLPNLFRQAERLKAERNLVIHGQWYPECSYPHPEDAALMCTPHSADTYAQAGPVCHVEGSRYRKWSLEQAWAVSEIEELADRLDQLANRFCSIYNLPDIP
ncbi:hypothetical protein ABZ319_14030 [Nocardia sp. NPDC005978]|uniref:hypothetical protein n=1 Tax=Nocardia sp. NPDC005978 TaxID=3156725 RepID=UPI0033A99732